MAVPKLRFKADDGSDYPNWEETKLDTLMAFKNGINASGDKFGRGTKCISVMDILNNSCITYDVIKGEVDVDEKTLQIFTVEYGDAVFQRSSENVQDAGRANVYMDKDRPATFSGFVIRGKRIANYEPMFMNGLLNTFSVRKQIMSKAQGAQHINIGQEILSSVRVNMPSLLEQQKIAEFLSTIDTVIEKQKETVSAWEERNKGVMQKLFSQEVRFKADDGSDFPEWEEKKLGDDVQFLNGRAYKQDELLKSGKYLVLRVGNLFTNDSYYYSDLELDDDKYIENGNLIYAWSATFGPRIYHGEKCIYHYHIWKLKFDENAISKMFLNYCLLHDVENIKSQRTGGTMVHITKNAMENRKLYFPCFAEQQKIADCLSSLDDVIEKQKATLAAWKEMKKGLLQQMFV